MRRPRYAVLAPFAVLLVVATLYSLASLVATLTFAYLDNSFSSSDSVWTAFWLSLVTCLVCGLHDYFVVQFVFRNMTCDRATAGSVVAYSLISCSMSIALAAVLGSQALSSVDSTLMASVCVLCQLSLAAALLVGRRNLSGLDREDARLLRVSTAQGSVANLVAAERLSRLDRQERGARRSFLSPYKRIRAYAHEREAEAHPAVTRDTQKLVFGADGESTLSDALDSYNQHPNLALEVTDLQPPPAPRSKRPVPISVLDEKPLFASPRLKGLIWVHLVAVVALQAMLMYQGAKVAAVPDLGPLEEAGALRRLRVYDYEDIEGMSKRYTASLSYLRFPAGSVPPASSSNYTFTVLVHDAPLDHSEMAPLAAELARRYEEEGRACTVLVPDRLGHGLTEKGGNASPKRDAHVLQQLVLAEFYAQRTGRALSDTRELAAALEGVGATQEFLEEHVRVACVGHGEGARVCEDWRAAHTEAEPHVPLSGGLALLDYFPIFALERELGLGPKDLLLRPKAEADWRRVFAPLGVVPPVEYALSPRLEGEGAVPGGLDVEQLNTYLQEKLPWAQDTALLWESKYELLADNAARADRVGDLESWDGSGVRDPVLLLGLSYSECQDGPSAVPCGAFADAEERGRALRSVQASLAEALAAPGGVSVSSEEYAGPPSDLWRSPGALARAICAFTRSNLE